MEHFVESEESTCELRIVLRTDPPIVFSKEMHCFDVSIEELGNLLLEDLLKEIV